MCGRSCELSKQLKDFNALNEKEDLINNKNYLFRFSAHTGLNEAVKELVNEVDINQRAGYALRYACLYNHIKVVRTLLEKGADVHVAQDCAIVWAAEFGHLEVVKMLLKAGAHRTPEAVQMAKENGHEEIVKLLKG
jgi:ankyrin repeat protein